MKFVHRLAYYLLGLLLGGIFVFFFFQKKKTEFCYMPNCRVLKDLRSKPIEITTDADAKMKEKVITLEDIRVCLQNGDVDFSRSNKPEGNGKLYVVEGFTTKNEAITVEMINQSEKVILKTISAQ